MRIAIIRRSFSRAFEVDFRMFHLAMEWKPNSNNKQNFRTSWCNDGFDDDVQIEIKLYAQKQ